MSNNESLRPKRKTATGKRRKLFRIVLMCNTEGHKEIGKKSRIAPGVCLVNAPTVGDINNTGGKEGKKKKREFETSKINFVKSNLIILPQSTYQFPTAKFRQEKGKGKGEAQTQAEIKRRQKEPSAQTEAEERDTWGTPLTFGVLKVFWGGGGKKGPSPPDQRGMLERRKCIDQPSDL